MMIRCGGAIHAVVALRDTPTGKDTLIVIGKRMVLPAEVLCA